ncbi:hypothetical protein [Pelagibius sp. 7325]|uniref:hypothetical protein n=1 Tax=Pelagibius sp. 7325 TaxID=3131994 RepID=UPI0030EBDDC2
MPLLQPLVDRAKALVPEFMARLTVRRDSGPIDSVDSLCGFVSTRAAYVAQKTLYGYLKTRMGTRYPHVFEDEVFITSVDIAKLQIYAACLSDLAIFAVSRVLQDAPAGPGASLPAASLPDAETCRALALHCFERGLADNAGQAGAVAAFSPEEALAAFRRRLAFWDWDGGPQGRAIFTESPAALVRWAPIAQALKKHDAEIVENSIKFTWRDVRQALDKRVDGAAVLAGAAHLASRAGAVPA